MNKYTTKQTALFKALDRVINRLQMYSATPEQPHEDWNQWHDLRHRIEARMQDNTSQYHAWHWEKFGYNIY